MFTFGAAPNVKKFSNCGTVSFCPVRNSKMSLFSNRDHKFCSGVVNCSKLKRCLPKSWLAMCINGLRSVSLIKNISPSLLISLFWLKMLASRWALIKFWFSTIKFCAWHKSCCFLINSAEFSSWKGKLSVKLFSSLLAAGILSLLEKSWHWWWIELEAAWLSSKCSPNWSLHLAQIDCLLISHDFLSLMYCLAKIGSNSSGLSEHSCSHSHIEQCF